VIAADRQDANHSGADLHVNTQQHALPDAVRSLTAGKGADVVLDAVGGPMFELALQSLAKGGRQIAIASAGGTRVSFDLVDFYHNQSRLFGLDTLQLDAATLAAILDDLRRGFEAGFLTPPATKSYPLAQAVSAFEAVERGGGLLRHALVSAFR
jgi:NADPH:quinone reductase